MSDVTHERPTNGSLLRGLLVLAAPLLVQNFVGVVNQAIDLFWLGRLSGDAVAAVGLSFPIIALMFALAGYTPFVGTQVLVSQRVGGDDAEGARRSLGTGLAVAIGFGVGVGALAYLTIPTLVEFLVGLQPDAVNASVRDLAVTYLRVFALGLVVLVVSDTLEAAFIGHGDSRASLYINVVAVAVNLTLDPVLIFGLFGFPALGIAGAALATVLGSVAGLALAIALVAAGRNDRMLSWAAVHFDPVQMYELLDVGTPTAAQQGARQLVGLAVIAVVIATAGGSGLAAYYLGAQVATIAFVPAIGLQQAAQSVVGQNLGAGHPDRAGRVTWLGVAVAVGGLAVVGVLQWFVPGVIVDTLAPELGFQATNFSVAYLQILAVGYPAIGAAYLLEAGFNGARRTRTSFVATMLQFWAIRLPLAVVGAFALGFGVYAVFWAVTLSNVAVAVGLAAYYHRSVAGGMLDRAAEQVRAAD